VRNVLIVDAADMVVVLWNGKSVGIKFFIGYAREKGKKLEINLLNYTGR